MEGVTRGEEPAAPPATLLVQELVGTGGEAAVVPSRYVVRQHGDRPAAAAAAAAAPIPVVDLGRLLLSSSGQDDDDQGGAGEEAAKLRSALQSWGLFLASNHGVEASVMDAMMEVCREFFRLPLAEKQRYSNLIGGERFQHEGYGHDEVKADEEEEEQVADWSDRLYLQVEPEEERDLSFWPQNPKHFRDVLHEYTRQCNRVKDKLLPAMARLLGIQEDYFTRKMGHTAGVHTRLIYYPPCLRPDLVFGLRPHSDATVVTLLMADDNVGGLQVLMDGVWYNVPTRRHTLLINLGDSTEIMSNGIFKSSVHRVVTNAEKERISVVMFYGLDLEKEIGPAYELVDDKRPALYKKVKIRDYVAGLYEHFSQGKRVIDTVKI